MDAVEDIKSRLSIEDVIGEYVELKRAGRNFKALSPFGNEKTPSFMVSPEKQIWHDFSTGKGGNMFSFVMEMEGLDFKGALELLARKAGIDITQYRSGQNSARGKHKERLLEVMDLAAKFYQIHFSKNQAALEYIFKKRAFTKEIALLFRIGYAPESGEALFTFLKSKGFTEQEQRDAGLVVQRYRGPGDMFRGRIMIPLMDPQGRVIGFTARILMDDPNAPKYINTPQTVLYDKGRHVFGLNFAKDAIRRVKHIVVVEGNLDVIASHQAGVGQVVATAGTAMTDMHFTAISRFTSDVRLAFDQDNAGINATERAIPLANKSGVSLSIIDIPAGKDPDELIKKDPQLWQKAIEQTSDALDWLIAQYEKRADLNTYAGRDQFKQAVLLSLKRLQSAGEQGVYAKKVAKILGYSEDAIHDELMLIQEGRKTYKAPARKLVKVDSKAIERHKVEDHFLSLMLMQHGLRMYLKPLTAEMFVADHAKELVEYLLEHPDHNVETAASGELRTLEDYGKILLLQYEELYQGIELVELRNEAARLQNRLIDLYVKSQKNMLAEAMRHADEATMTVLLNKAKALDQLLNKH